MISLVAIGLITSVQLGLISITVNQKSNDLKMQATAIENVDRQESPTLIREVSILPKITSPLLPCSIHYLR